MNKGTKKLHIFKSGTHTAMSGASIAFSDGDLEAMVAAYDPALHEAPMVVGHPKHDAPAVGWIAGIAFSEEGLFAEPKQVNPAFAEAVGEGAFKKISASFYSPGAPNHPLGPDSQAYYLRHVGFLGAMPPAVKGLTQFEFAEDEEGVVELEFADSDSAQMWAWDSVKRVFRNLKNWLIEKEGQEAADKLIPEWSIDEADDASDAIEEEIPEYSDPTEITDPEEGDMAGKNDEVEELKRKLQAAEDENEALKEENQSFAESSQQARRESAESFADGLVSEGKVLPRHKGAVIELLAGLDDSVELEFAEGEDGETKKVGRASLLREVLAAGGKVVDYGEVSGGEGAADSGNPDALVEAAKKYRAQQAESGIDISFADAVEHVASEEG